MGCINNSISYKPWEYVAFWIVKKHTISVFCVIECFKKNDGVVCEDKIFGSNHRINFLQGSAKIHLTVLVGIPDVKPNGVGKNAKRKKPLNTFDTK